MKRESKYLSSWLLTCGLLLVLVFTTLAEIKMKSGWGRFWTAAKKAYITREQANALANAIEQYSVDFPDAGPLGNTQEWTERLGGNNPKGIEYLKVETYARDSTGRLLDPCGSPWIIEVPGSPGFEHMVTPGPPNEFHVVSAACGGFAIGNRSSPKFPRS